MKRGKGRLWLALALALTVSLGVVSGASAGMGEVAGVDLSGFTAELLTGGAADATLFADTKLTMVNVWGTFCGPCINEMPDLGQIDDEWREKGVKIVGIVIDATDPYTGQMLQGALDAADQIVAFTKADYAHLLPSDTLVDALLQDVMYVPTTIFVDENGVQVGKALIGSRDKASWEAEIEAALKLLPDDAV